jgi:hypothetical protein
MRRLRAIFEHVVRHGQHVGGRDVSAERCGPIAPLWPALHLARGMCRGGEEGSARGRVRMRRGMSRAGALRSRRRPLCRARRVRLRQRGGVFAPRDVSRAARTVRRRRGDLPPVPGGGYRGLPPEPRLLPARPVHDGPAGERGALGCLRGRQRRRLPPIRELPRARGVHRLPWRLRGHLGRRLSALARVSRRGRVSARRRELRHWIEMSSMSNTSLPAGAPGRLGVSP